MGDRVSSKLNWQLTGVVKRDQILRGEYGKEADGFVSKSNKISKSNGIIYYVQNVEGLFAIITFNFHAADVSIN